MTKQLIIIVLLVLSFKGYSQNETHKSNSIGISIPIIWNNSEATFYSLGNRKEPTGKGMSYGININYSRTVYKNLFGVLGIGYFRQVFGIERPFNYITPDGTKPMVYTKAYIYNTVHLIAGIGYQKKLNGVLSVKGIASYNWYNSYRQKYSPGNVFVGNSQINHKSIALGNMINLSMGI